MNAKKTDLKELEGWYEKSGNQLMLLYGGMDCRKEQLIKEFCVGKKYFYYRCRQLSAQEQMQKMGEEIQNAFQMKLSRYSYDEFFNRVKSGDASKLVIVIDEAQYQDYALNAGDSIICQKYFKTEDEKALSGTGNDHSGVFFHCMGHAGCKRCVRGWIPSY